MLINFYAFLIQKTGCRLQKTQLMHPHIPSMDWRGVLRTGAVVKVWPDVDDGATLVVMVVVVPHHQAPDAVPWSHHAGAAEAHLLRILVKFHGREDSAQIQLWNVVEDRQRQH